MKLSVRKQPVSFMKGLVLFYLIFLAIFFASAPFLTLLLYAETDLTKSLLPQLIGFCLQGAFLVVVFALYEKRSLINAKHSHKLALRTFLVTFVDLCLPNLQEPPSDASTEALLPLPAAFAAGLDLIRAQGLDETIASRLRSIAEKNLLPMSSLTFVAAQIDHYHLKNWNAIMQNCRDIRNTDTAAETGKKAVKLLENIRKFDEIDIY